LAAAITAPAGLSLPDAKRIHRAIFGVYFEEDIYERATALVPAAMRCLSWRMPKAMAARRLIFVHVPRVAGTSIARALYGPVKPRHHSIRYYRAIDPRFFEQADSFALVRDPFDRFASAYAFVRGGGTAACRPTPVFAAATARVKSVDDYLSFLEDRDILDLDFVMRPQFWFICDLESGRPLVKNLFLYRELYADGALVEYLAAKGVKALPWLNAASRPPLALTERQRERIGRLYAEDVALVEALRAARRTEMAALRVAAE